MVSQLKWFAAPGRNTFYAATWVGPWRERQLLKMHHLIFGKPAKGLFIDHQDGDGLNNRRNNLRESTRGQNSANRVAYGKSKYLGVSPYHRTGKPRWRAFVGNKYIGIFPSEEAAAIAYNEAAVLKHGEFAKLNVIPPSKELSMV